MLIWSYKTERNSKQTDFYLINDKLIQSDGVSTFPTLGPMSLLHRVFVTMKQFNQDLFG